MVKGDGGTTSEVILTLAFDFLDMLKGGGGDDKFPLLICFTLPEARGAVLDP